LAALWRFLLSRRDLGCFSTLTVVAAARARGDREWDRQHAAGDPGQRASRIDTTVG
jgi:hypothetical protein